MLVLGHTNPDSDSVAGAIALADFLSKKNNTQVTPIVQGEINPEAAFLLEQAGVAKPELRTSVAGEQVWLIDYSDLGQAPADIKEAQICGIVDHHKLGDITTAEPLECWIQPVGCSCTILFGMYQFEGIEIDPAVAKLMLGAIVSDTVMFNSPTTTDKDRVAADKLATIAGIEDLNAFADAQFAAKSDVSNVADEDLIMRDLKVYEMNGKSFSIAQLEMTSLAPVLARKDALIEKVKAYRAENGYHTAMVLLTDIRALDSMAFVESDEAELVVETLGGSWDGDLAMLPGVVSRKKQVLPPLQKKFG